MKLTSPFYTGFVAGLPMLAWMVFSAMRIRKSVLRSGCPDEISPKHADLCGWQVHQVEELIVSAATLWSLVFLIIFSVVGTRYKTVLMFVIFALCAASTYWNQAYPPNDLLG